MLETADVVKPASMHFLLIGRGLIVHKSTIGDNAGNGVFTTCPILENQIITFYDGELVYRDRDVKAHNVGEDAELYTHTMAIQKSPYLIHGLTDARVGRGAGSFINHSNNPRFVNVRFRVTRAKRFSLPPSFAYDGVLGMQIAISQNAGCKDLEQPPTIIIVATRNINSGEELFIRYPQRTVQRLQLDGADTRTQVMCEFCKFRQLQFTLFSICKMQDPDFTPSLPNYLTDLIRLRSPSATEALTKSMLMFPVTARTSSGDRSGQVDANTDEMGVGVESGTDIDLDDINEGF